MLNQIDLFGNEENEEVNFLEDIDDWKTDVKLTKEFETIGFYISDHPLNQYKKILHHYNVISFDDFNNNKDILSSNIACTVLKVQEKKTQKGNSYAIIKFSDLSNVFELFIFSDIFDVNREILSEGNSLIITLIKNFTDESKNQIRINVKKIVPLKELINKPIKNITFNFRNINDLSKLKNLSLNDAETNVKFYLKRDRETLIFKLKNKRKINNNLLNTLELEKNIEID